jgi:hypothetical protein
MYFVWFSQYIVIFPEIHINQYYLDKSRVPKVTIISFVSEPTHCGETLKAADPLRQISIFCHENYPCNNDPKAKVVRALLSRQCAGVKMTHTKSGDVVATRTFRSRSCAVHCLPSRLTHSTQAGMAQMKVVDEVCVCVFLRRRQKLQINRWISYLLNLLKIAERTLSHRLFHTQLKMYLGFF